MLSPVSESFRPAIVAPTYNNARTLSGVLNELTLTALPLIVVNDGCTDDSATMLRSWLATSTTDGPDRFVVTHEINRGKAQAMASGFERARELGYTHALTIDTDGQHDVADVLPMIARAAEHPDSLVLGSRPMGAGYPTGSRVGRFISNLMIWIESGTRVSDSQCGLRVYPLAELAKVPTFADRFGFETEVITRFAWAGGLVQQRSVKCIYEVAGGRTSHFRPWRDSFSASFMHLRLLGRSVLPWPVGKTVNATADHGTVFERLANWFNPLRTFRQMKTNPAEREKLASGIATGVFIATVPAYGLKTVLCLAAAKVLKAPPLLLLTTSTALNVSFTSPFTIAASIAVGHMLLTGEWPALGHYNLRVDGFWKTFGKVGGEWLLGSVIVGAALAAIAYAIVRFLLNLGTPDASDQRFVGFAPAPGAVCE